MSDDGLTRNPVPTYSTFIERIKGVARFNVPSDGRIAIVSTVRKKCTAQDFRIHARYNINLNTNKYIFIQFIGCRLIYWRMLVNAVSKLQVAECTTFQ